MGIFNWSAPKAAVPEEEAPETPEEEKPKEDELTLEKVQASFDEKLSKLTETIQGVVSASKPIPADTQSQAAPKFEMPPEVPDEDIEAAMESGDYKTAMKLQRQQRDRDKLELKVQQAQLETNGMNYIGALTRSQMRGSLKNFKAYEKEIDTVLATFDPSIRSNPEVLRGVYDMVRGRHVEDETAAAIEESKRQMNLDPAPEVGNQTQRGPKGAAKKPKTPKTVEEAFGAEAAAALNSMGRDPDEVAKKLGYDNFAHYAAAADDLNEHWTERMHKW